MAGEEKESGSKIAAAAADSSFYYLQKFQLFETLSNFYIRGKDNHKASWRVLKISRVEPTELNIVEDAGMYTEQDCGELLNRLQEGNRSTGGLKFVTTCYGIVGFIKFLGPHYMLLITKRRKIGVIDGHRIYAITNVRVLTVQNSTLLSNMHISKDEKRYKKLLSTVDLTKDFFFSYSYNIMCSLQKNLATRKSSRVPYESMFVWNEYLTREIRSTLKSNLWTVALVHGFFKQVKLSVSDKDFKLTLIARRSRHFAGTRFLKRGVNERGRVANDVETEQIISEDNPEGHPMQISSSVQVRGSIPLFWSQETSRLNLRPDIILSRNDQTYEATRLHFENLSKRYGNPIIILNLIKMFEPKPRETILRAEFANAIRFINKRRTRETRLRFLHWDLNKCSKTKGSSALELLVKVAVYAAELTGIFFRRVGTPSKQDIPSTSYSTKFDNGESGTQEISYQKKDGDANNDPILKPAMLQNGVLRTNCIDCLDRTNVAQYAYGLVSLGKQLHALGYILSPNIDLDNPLAEDLMVLYESMGDILAMQYGGSAAHNKIFCERRGQWKPATQSQELFRTIQRYYSNAYVDAVKQDAINIFLGYFQPRQGKTALWQLDSDQHHIDGRQGPSDDNQTARPFIRRSLSDGNILCDSDMDGEVGDCQNHQVSDSANAGKEHLSGSLPEIFMGEKGISFCRCMTNKGSNHLPQDNHQESTHICFNGHVDSCHCSNFLDMEWLSSSENSGDEDIFERSSSTARLSQKALSHGETTKTVTSMTSKESVAEYPKSFAQWVEGEGMFD